MKYIMLLLSFSVLFVSSVQASDQPVKKNTLISLSATSNIKLPNDEVVILYRIEATGSNAKKLRQRVNLISQAVQKILKGEKDLQQNTLSRRMEIIWRYDQIKKRQVRDGWKLVQQEQLTSTRMDAIPHWVDGIEKAGAQLSALNFRISNKSMRTAKETLRLQAIQRFRQKAMSFAKALGAKSFHILHLETEQHKSRYPVREAVSGVAMMSKSSSDPMPSFHAGEREVSVTVSGDIAVPFISYLVK